MSTQHVAGDPEDTKSLSAAEYAFFGTETLPKDKKKFTIFLVEDDSTDRNSILQMLSRSPFVHNVHSFDSGDSMLKYFVKEGYYSGTLIHHIPTLIMIDIRIPGTDGLKVLKRLKENPLTKDIAVIMITGDISNEKVSEAFRPQANAFIAKPLHLERIHEVMFTGWSWPGATRDYQN